MSKLKGLMWVGVVAGLGIVASIGLPRLAQHIPWRVERWMGSLIDGPDEDNVCGEASVPARSSLQHLVGRLYPLKTDDARIQIRVSVNRGETVNAYATLGGRVYLYDGLLQQAQSPEELGGVLAHEIEHVRQRHIIEGAVVSLLTWGGLKAIFQGGGIGITHALLTLSFGREQEAEADEQGLQRLRAAQVDAAGFANFFERARQSAAPPAILSSHPADNERAERAARFTGYPTHPLLTPSQWTALREICGPQVRKP